ncbi:MAG TPA: ABC transporter permease [Acidimicrobiales bacterium]|nr:ABC transporter permease [Acidimicrobiales bacterium]
MTTDAIATPMPRVERSSIRWAGTNILTIAWRNLMAILRIPELLFFSTLQPIMFVLLFRYVFAGAISKPGLDYVSYLMPGIFVQTVCFGAVSTAIGLADDLQKGLIERFRALPMSRTAVLAGRTVADVCRNIFVIVVMTIVALLVGFRPTGGALNYFFAFLIMLLFAFALSWGFAYVGLSAPSTETAQVMAFPLLFPLTFASSCFVPVYTLPSWLRGWATYQPVSQVADEVRHLMVGNVGATPPFTNHLLPTLAWTLGFLVVLVPLSVRKFRNAI